MEFDPTLHQQLTLAVLAEGVQRRRRPPVAIYEPTMSGHETDDGYAIDFMGVVTFLNPAVVDIPTEALCFCPNCRPKSS